MYNARKYGMRRLASAISLFVFFVLLVIPGSSQNSDSESADILFVNGRIYTAYPAQAWANALAVKGQSIVAVLKNSDLREYQGPKTTVINLHGRMAMPGIIDCHTHFLRGSQGLGWIDLEGVSAAEEAKQRIRAYASSHPKAAWVRGGGWLYGLFPPSGLPTKELLDEVLPDRPAAIDSYDLHSLWVNSLALKLAGITANTSDPVINGVTVGTIVRDPRTGEPTGVLKEAAMELIWRKIAKPPIDEQLLALRAGLAYASRLGITSIVNASGDLAELRLYDELHRRGELTLRTTTAFAVIGYPHRLTSEELASFDEGRRRYHDDWVRAGVVKFFADGVVETHTAAMLEPYADDPKLRGSTNYTPEVFQNFVLELDRRNFQIITHAIGDRAVRMALDAYEAAERQNGPRDRRFRIDHIETVSPDDIPRFARLGVVASMQPYHLCIGECPDEGDVWATNLGPTRLRHAMAWQELEAAGTRLVFGSDWPVASLNPFFAIQTAITRRDLHGQPAGGWHGEQKLTLEQALAGYTRDAAYAAFLENQVGTLQPKKYADLIVLSQNLFDAPALEISKTRVELTMVGGRIVYQDDSLAGSVSQGGGRFN
jgi:predicted amidohydrolase YtcJ